MDAINIPSENVPAELRSAVEQTLKRANELKKVDPVVSYWCKLLLMQQAIANGEAASGLRRRRSKSPTGVARGRRF